MSGASALEHGFRLQVPGTQLWFNVRPELWGQVRAALEALGCEWAQDGLSGDEVCQGGGISVSYSAEAGRMRAELDGAGEAGVAGCLEALRAAVPPPDAEASAVWIWGPEPFRVAGRSAEAAQRVMRGARWTAPGGESAEVLAAAAAAAAALGDTLTMHASVGAMCTLEVASPSEVRGGVDLTRRASAFGTLIARLGQPARAEYATVSASGAEG